MATRTNYWLGVDNAAGRAGYFGATVVVDTAVTRNGRSTLKVTQAGTNEQGVILWPNQAVVASGSPLAITIDVLIPSGVIAYVGGRQESVSEYDNAIQVTGNGAWQTITTSFTRTTANQVGFQVVMFVPGNTTAPAGTVLAMSLPIITAGTTTGAYFDGDSPDTGSVDYGWTGTARQSTSQAVDIVAAGPSRFDRGDDGMPSTVPRLLGRESYASLSGAGQGSFPVPTGTSGFTRRGEILPWTMGSLPVPTAVATTSGQRTARPAGNLPQLTATFTTSAVVLPEFHVTGSGRMVDLAAGPQSLVLGRRRAGVGALPVLEGTASLVTNRFVSASGVLPLLMEHEATSFRTFRAFQTPAYREQFVFPTTRLPGFLLQAMSVWRLAGAWDYGPVADPALIGDPEVFLRGGHIHYLSPTDEAELTAAGLGDHFYNEVRR